MATPHHSSARSRAAASRSNIPRDPKAQQHHAQPGQQWIQEQEVEWPAHLGHGDLQRRPERRTGIHEALAHRPMPVERVVAEHDRAPSARHALRPRNCANANNTMLAPMAQMTCKKTRVLPPSCSMPPGENGRRWISRRTPRRSATSPASAGMRQFAGLCVPP